MPNEENAHVVADDSIGEDVVADHEPAKARGIAGLLDGAASGNCPSLSFAASMRDRNASAAAGACCLR